MATIDSYVVGSRADPVSRSARRRVLWVAAAAALGLAVAADLGFSRRAVTPVAVKFEARVAADPAPYFGRQGDEQIAAFQQSVAISHLTAIASAPLAPPRPAPASAKPPHAPKPAPARKLVFAPIPPPRPAAGSVAEERTLPPAASAAAPAGPKPSMLTQIVRGFQRAPEGAVEFASGVTAHLQSLRARVGL